MTKISLTDIVNLENQTTAVNNINANNAAIEAASDNTLSRDGTLPNSMLAALDMNSRRIMNLPAPASGTEPVRLQDISGITIPVSEENSLLNALDASGDGVTNVSAKFTTATGNGPVFLPQGTYNAPSFNEFGTWKTWGFGQIKDNAGNIRAPAHIAITALPTTYAGYNGDNADTVFNADYSKCHTASETFFDTAAIGTSPGTGAYFDPPRVSMTFQSVFSRAGFHDIVHSDRSGIGVNRLGLGQAGQGDLLGWFAVGAISQALVGQTQPLQGPAITHSASDFYCFVNGGYLNTVEHHLHDVGFDCSGLGCFFELERSNDTASLGQFWGGYSVSSSGSKKPDFAYRAVGGFSCGLDLLGIVVGASKNAISVPANSRMVWGGTNGIFKITTPGTDYIENSAATWFNVVVNGTQSLQIAPAFLRLGGTLNDSAGTQLLTTRRTGWVAMTGAANRNTVYDPSTITLAQLAARVSALQIDLTTHGVIGA